jgi:hypothetical protein
MGRVSPLATLALDSWVHRPQLPTVIYMTPLTDFGWPDLLHQSHALSPIIPGYGVKY